MKKLLSALALGLIMAFGLGLAGMTLPEKVVGFLDFTGKWDPSLMFVLGAAVMVYGIIFRLVIKRPKPVFEPAFSVPTRRDITGSLIVGAILFGAGWGLTGFCPAPAMLSLTTGEVGPLVFVAAMFAGMYAFKLYDAQRAKAAERAATAAQPLPKVSVERSAA